MQNCDWVPISCGEWCALVSCHHHTKQTLHYEDSVSEIYITDEDRILRHDIVGLPDQNAPFGNTNYYYKGLIR